MVKVSIKKHLDTYVSIAYQGSKVYTKHKNIFLHFSYLEIYMQYFFLCFNCTESYN